MKTNSIIQLLNDHKIVIPPIQRDYAQGRNTGKIPHIRGRFLDDIVRVLKDDDIPPLQLDFVYGYIEKDKTSNNEDISVFKPLDGQQRLTTLFLIHWFIANKEDKLEVAKGLLKKFSYSTRHSSRSFCENLTYFAYVPGGLSVDKQIVDQPWFFSAWHNDPTVASMLVVLRDIELKFHGIENVWDKLTGKAPRIIFHLLPMEDIGLPDDLYIKMNARGKGLTDFEHFKSQFSELLDEEFAKEFQQKIDKEWSDLFWNIFKDKNSTDIANDVDNGFLSFFWYITDILIAKHSIVLDSTYWLHKIKAVYYRVPLNVKFLFDSLNLFEKTEKDDPTYFEDLFYVQAEDFSVTKTRLFFNSPQANLFRKCAETYGFDERKNSFTVGEQLLLYAFIFMNLKGDGKVNNKFRTLRNVFSSSEDQLRNEYLPVFLYDDVESIIAINQLSPKSKLSKRQFEEENIKGDLIEKNPGLTETVYRLEDHSLLRGNIALFDLDISLPSYAEQFHKIFIPGCDYFEISKTLLTFGDYTQSYGKFRRFGNRNNSTWREIFTQSESRKGFDNTKSILRSYMDTFIADSLNTNQTLLNNYLNAVRLETDTPKDFRYYYITYANFSTWGANQTDGFYWWDDYQNNPYECTMLFRTNYRGRHWNPFLLQLSFLNEKCSLENYGSHLQYTYGDLILLIVNKDAGFQFSAVDEFSNDVLSTLIATNKLNEDGVLLVNQNEYEIDMEDRIIKCNEFLQNLQLP